MRAARTIDHIVGGRIGEQRRQLGLSIGKASISSWLSNSQLAQIEKG